MRSYGFTLLEMLIALAVIAIVGLTLSSAVGNVIGQTHTLEQRLVAHWVAENYLARMRLARMEGGEPLPMGRAVERVRMSGRSWRVERNTRDTTHRWLRRVEIDVYEITEDEDIGPLDTMVGFIGRY